MLEIIPAIDLVEGKCVRLEQGDFGKLKVYSDDPLSMAQRFEKIGLRRLHMVDLDGAKTGKISNHRILEKIAKHTNLIIDYGGGIKTQGDLETVLNCGAQMVNIGSIAAVNPPMMEEWINMLGEDKFLLGADVHEKKIAVRGWQETSEWELFGFLSHYQDLGVKTFFCTDITRDGLLAGPSFDLYGEILNRFPLMNLVASGGVSKVEDIKKLDALGCSGVILGKAIYERRIDLEELRLLIAD